MLLKSSLFSHAVSSPDVGISIPVQNMVENSLEKNGPKILLPQIVDAVTALQETAREEAAKSTTDSSPPKQVDSTSAASGKSNPEMGTLDLPLPIIIPGLNVGTKKEGGGGESGVKSSKKESAADPSKAKAKTKASVESSGGAVGGNKEAKQGLAKGAPQKASLGKAIGKEKTKQKEKDSRSPIDEKEESKEVSPQNEDDQLKEKGRGLASGKVKKTPREEKLDQKEKESEKHPDRKGKESTIADLKEVAKKESSGKKEKDLKDGNKSECTALDQTTGQDVISKDDPEDGKHSIEDEVEVKGPVTGGSGGRGRRKQLAPKRRSARLASLNEESPDEQTANEKAKSSTEEVNIDTSEATVLQETGKKKASAVTVVEKEESAATLRPSGHKRLCVLESNSDEESVTTHQTSSEEEKGYESETEQSKEEEVRKRKRKRAREGTKRAGNREAVQSHITDTSKRLGQKRSLDACRDDQERRSNSPVTKKVKKNNGKQPQDETKLSPAKQKSPSPVVVTR